MDFRDVIGLGVAGNFAGHLEQAGEASDFVGVEVKDVGAPKGLFPFYLPGVADLPGLADHRLSVYPISADRLALAGPGETLQIEPEVALLCDIEAEGDTIKAVQPRAFAAHDDCSIRREGAKKISEKKNWGPCTKGTSDQLIDLDRFSAGGILDRHRIACFLVRDGVVHTYGQDSAAASYSYFHEQLLEWIVEKLNEQQDSGPLENVGELWRRSGRPSRALISIGATRYTEFGEKTFLEAGDRGVVVVYDGERFDEASLRSELEAGGLETRDGRSVLDQLVVPAVQA